MQKCAATNRRFQFQKRSQLFLRTHNETLSVIAMRVGNPDCSPVGIHGLLFKIDLLLVCLGHFVSFIEHPDDRPA
jgi:hypothetical protein